MKAGKNIELSISQEVAQGSWPLPKNKRTWTSWGLAGVALSAGVAAWSYSIGGYVAYYLNATMGTLAMIAGCLVGMFFVVLATVPVSVKYGVENIASSKPIFGQKGSVFAILLQYASIVGWNCLLIILFGKAVSEVLLATGLLHSTSQQIVTAISSLVAISISWISLRGGSAAVKNTSLIISLLVGLTGILIMYKLISTVGITKIFHAKPLASSGDRLWDYTAGFEILVASVLSWWPYMGGIVRMVPSSGKTLWPTMLGMGLPTGVISLIGLYSALATGNYDPTKWFVEVGGIGFGIIALLFLALANIGTAIVGAYTTGIGLRQIKWIEKKTSWNQTTLIVLLPVAIICVFFADQFLNSIPSFLAFLGVVFAPIIGIQITDYFLLRKQRISLNQLYMNGKESKYYFWKGVNVAAFISCIIGFFAYIYLLDPITYKSASFFKYTSASIPVIILSGLCYFLLTKIIVIPSKKGDYL
ncbi:purine-cytosine permease family protein [Bacillus salipaludis]|nr:cytosine permease [Bacillus salipaludis]MDQ6594918.1 cytosine permease [Bacillus salipaludis]